MPERIHSNIFYRKYCFSSHLNASAIKHIGWSTQSPYRKCFVWTLKNQHPPIGRLQYFCKYHTWWHCLFHFSFKNDFSNEFGWFQNPIFCYFKDISVTFIFTEQSNFDYNTFGDSYTLKIAYCNHCNWPYPLALHD
jgi:hypothetical protein